MTDRYKIDSQIGEDVLGAVYLADDTMLQRRVMCRHIEYGDNPDAKQREDSWKKEFGKYAGQLGTMQHPNMLTIYDVSIEDSGAFVVTQLVEGESLADRLERGSLAQVGVYSMASDMLEALHAAHQSHIYHGALHTGSIKRVDRASGGHRYLLVDLGLNQLTSMVKGEKVKVADPVLMAPELHEDDNEPDTKADLFMLGQLCYTALVGGHPFSDKSSEECLEAYKDGGMPPLDQYVEGIEPEFAVWVMSLVECDPEKRPVDSGEAMKGLHAIQLDDPEPNVPGKTHAVEEQYIDHVSGPQVETTSQPVLMTASTASVHIAAANTAAASHMEMTQAQAINAAVVSEKKEKAMMVYLISGLVVALIIGGIVVASRSGEKSAATAIGESAEKGEHSIDIGEGSLVHTVAEQNNPVIIDVDSSKYLDWMIGAGIPISSEYISKEDGLYIQSVDTILARAGYSVVNNPIRFRSDGEVLFPRSAIYKNQQGERGAGYEIQLRIPANTKSSITVKLYILQKGADLHVEVMRPKDDTREMEVVPFTQQRVVMVPVTIDHPTPGDFYTFKVISGAGDNQPYMIGLSGVLIEKR